MLLLQVTQLGNNSTTDRVKDVRSFGLLRYATDVDASVGHGLVVRVLVLEPALTRYRAVERATVQRGRRERVERLERRARHSERVPERGSGLLLGELNGGLLGSRHVRTSVLANSIAVGQLDHDGLTTYTTPTLPYPTLFPCHACSLGSEETTCKTCREASVKHVAINTCQTFEPTFMAAPILRKCTNPIPLSRTILT
jgi:hypothetical protein